RNRYKFILVALCILVIPMLSSCRMDSGSWYTKPYTTYGNEWVDLWNGGAGMWNTFWGWPINLLSYPIAWICSNIGKFLGNSFFWGIFFTTIIVRTLAWPIYAKQNGLTYKMQQLQPEMNRIQQKYAGRQDPRSQQMMQQETQKLYKKYKINPLGCVVPMLLQFPIFMSMYEVVQRINATQTTAIDASATITYRGAFALNNTKLFNFFELNTNFFDASAIQDKIFAVVLAAAFIGLTLLQQKLGQRPMKYQKVHPNDKKKKQNNNQMKWVMIIMNVMFAFLILRSSSLGVYWVIGSAYQILQSQIVRLWQEHKYFKSNIDNDNVF
ncbi:MAG: YidC/Oxa1 family membrane protein insertase, partial [Acholeplasmatales bacterium]|nr:YidC/Oxa1 family membrane protein insertase [Acholeplasmatales bacterium]